jgi:S-adenosylmethionine:tRNA ribosyltransferase-isomerase
MSLNPVWPIIGNVLVSEFDFHLPPELIAQHPATERDAARMLHLQGRRMTDACFRDFPELLRPSDLVIFNDTRVLPARLFGHRRGRSAQPLSPANPASRDFLHGTVEVLLTRRLPGEEQTWQALVRPGRKIMPGERVYFGEEHSPLLEAEILDRGEFGERTLRFLPVPDFTARLEQLGHIPLPPYIDRPDTDEDRQRYQTVFARDPGSVAAPTAGLHFTDEILERMRQRGIETASVTLHVGLGTFAPIRTEVVEEHRIHTEWYRIPVETAEKIMRAKRAGHRVVAIGTTTVRTLEYAAGGRAPAAGAASVAAYPTVGAGAGNALPAVDAWPEEQNPLLPIIGQQACTGCGPLTPAVNLTLAGEANIFIYPGYRFRVVNAMLTNFHLPKSTLLMLVAAFAGRERILAAYEHAVRERYRFFSYGDCMFLE